MQQLTSHHARAVGVLAAVDVLAALDTLPAFERRVLVLHQLGRLTAAEIAARTGIRAIDLDAVLAQAQHLFASALAVGG